MVLRNACAGRLTMRRFARAVLIARHVLHVARVWPVSTVLLAPALGAAVAGPVAAGDRMARPASYPRSVYFDPRDVSDQVPPEIVARFDAVVVSENADTTWLDQVRAANPEIKLLLFIAGSAVRDTIKDGWDPADTLTVQGLLKVRTVQNGWLLKDVAGSPITTWASPIFDTWAVNLTAHCPPGPGGERFAQWAARAIARRFSSTQEGVASYSGWSGLLLDQMFNGISWVQGSFGNGAIDADGDGIPDDPEALNEAWRQEMALFLQELRSEVGDGFMITLNGDTVTLEETDGQCFEDCLAGRPWLEDMYGLEYHHGGYLRNLALSRPGSNQFCVFYARYYDGLTDLPPARFARLAAGSSCLGDGYYILERFHDGVFEPVLTAETYDLDIGYPDGNLERTVSLGDTLYARAFSKAYVQVNPNHRSIDGVPARDAIFTFYSRPDSLSVLPSFGHASVQWRVPAVTGNPLLLDGFEVAYAPFPFGEEGWHEAQVRRIKGRPGEYTAGDVAQAHITGLQPDMWYHVAVRSLFKGTYASHPTATLAFRTSRHPDPWVPPEGFGPGGDAFWWNPTAGTPNGVVRALLEHDGAMYVGGDFTRLGPQGTAHVARWEDGAWHALGAGLPANVRALAVHDGHVVAGGDPSIGESSDEALVASWNGKSWDLLEGLHGTVHAIVSWQGALLAAGEFASPTTSLRTYTLASWRDGEWEVLAGAPYLGDPRPKRALATYQGQLVGEGSCLLDGEAVPGVGAWTPRGWDPLGGALTGRIHSLTVHRGTLVAGGRFTSIGGTAAVNVARWDGDRWTNIGAGLTGDVRVVASVGSVLLAGGTIESSGDMPIVNLARWDDTFWTPLGSGADGPVLAIAGDGNGFFMGGHFESVGAQWSPFVARWEHSLWPIVEVDPSEPGVAPGARLSLGAPSPNPSGSSAVVEYVLPRSAAVRLIVFNAAGRAIRRLVDGVQPAGVHRVAWDGRDLRGRDVGPGVYVVQLRSGGQERSEKIVRAR